MRWTLSTLGAGIFVLAVTSCVYRESGPPPADDPAGKTAQNQYVCPMDGGARTTPGPCPKCGMTLDERHLLKSGDQPKGGNYVCPMDGGERSTPGPCPKCGMQLDERHRKTGGQGQGKESVYECAGCGATSSTPGSC